MSTVRRLHGRAFAPLVLTIAALIGVATPVSAGSGDPYYGPHSGKTGVHTLIDNQSENQGVTCVYGADFQLKKLAIRRPIVFAYNRTGGVDREWVAWRYIVEYADTLTSGGTYSNWPNFYASTWTKARATDDINAQWLPRSFHFGSNVADHLYYRVSILMKWYSPYPSKINVDGSAVDVVQWYRQTQPNEDDMTAEGFCPSAL